MIPATYRQGFVDGFFLSIRLLPARRAKSLHGERRTLNIQSTIFNPFSGAKETSDGIFSKPDQRIAVGKFLCAHRVGIFHGVQHSDAV
jgi:hypothetical protein